MRGDAERQANIMLAVTPESFVPADHPIRRIKPIVEAALQRLSLLFDSMYSRRGRPSIPPEHLLKASLLIALYSVRSERQFCEQLRYNLLFKWFLDLTAPATGAPPWIADRGVTAPREPDRWRWRPVKWGRSRLTGREHERGVRPVDTHGLAGVALAIVLAACDAPSEPTPGTGTTPTPTTTSTPTATPSPTATVMPSMATPTPTAAPATPLPTAPAAPADAPSALRYNAYDPTGEVTRPGSYAFLSADGLIAGGALVLTTYEGLRSNAAVLRIHESDAGGVSRATIYDAVKVGHLIEWRKAEDCFMRYRVKSVGASTAARRDFAVGPAETYAFQSCPSGTVPTGSVVAVNPARDGDLPNYGGASLTSFAVVHGSFQIVPEDWTGAVAEPTSHGPVGYTSSQPYPLYVENPTLALARALSYWREPALPAGWTLRRVSEGTVDDPPFGYTVEYSTPEGTLGLRIEGYYAEYRGSPREASWNDGAGVTETRTIAGRPAQVIYSPPGPNHAPRFPVKVWVFDPATGTEYAVDGYAQSRLGGTVEAVIAIARSLFESPNPLSGAFTYLYFINTRAVTRSGSDAGSSGDGSSSGAGSPTATEPLPANAPPPLRYEYPDSTGEVTRPGSYTFFSAVDSPSGDARVITTWSGLRENAASLLVHQNDANGATLRGLDAGACSSGTRRRTASSTSRSRPSLRTSSRARTLKSRAPATPSQAAPARSRTVGRSTCYRVRRPSGAGRTSPHR